MKRFSTLADCTALDFLNTRPLGSAGPVERLTDFTALVRWSAQMGLVQAPAAKRLASAHDGRVALSAALGLREALRQALERGTQTAWSSALRRINDARRPVAEIVVRRGGDFSLQTSGRMEAASDLVDAIAAEMARFVCSADLAYARKCQAGDCVLWFVDRTRNHSRAWCSMESCGARAKARAYYARKRQ